MNRTVRCLALFAIGVGAWACKGDPQSSLDRGTIAAVTADPARILIDQGSTTQVLIDARDNLNQAIEITSVTEVAGAGITFVRDFLFQPVFDAGATDQTSCDAITNSSWTGAGCLVPRTNPTRLRYEITGTALSETSFSVTINGSNTVDVPVTVTLSTMTGALSNVSPVSGEDVVLTLPTSLVFDPALVGDLTTWQGIVTVGSTPALVSDLQATSVTFQFGPNIVGPVVVNTAVLLPYNPSVPAQTMTTAEILTSPVLVAPYPVMLPAGPFDGYSVVVVTAGAGFVFGPAALVFLGDAGVGCPVDPTCVPTRIIARAGNGTSVDAVFPQNEMNEVHVTGMASDAAPVNSLFTTLNGETGSNITIAATTFAATVTLGLPASGVGLEVVRLTLTDADQFFDTTATVTSVVGAGFISTALDPAGQWIEYVQAGSSTGTPIVAGLNSISLGLDFELPAGDGGAVPVSVTVPANTFGPTTIQALAPDITALMPATGVSVLWYDDGDFGGDIFGTDRIYNISGAFDHTFVLGWNNSADVDILFSNNPVTGLVGCFDGATLDNPETSVCSVGAGSWSFFADLFGGAAPSILTITITGN